MGENVQHVFLVGAKGFGNYGGYETFINKLTEYHQNNNRLKYHVACKANGEGSMDAVSIKEAVICENDKFLYHNAECFRIRVPEKIGPAQAIYYDLMALEECCKTIKKMEKKSNAIVYIMACRIGPFMRYYYNKLHKLGAKIYLNPDGHEWMRAKWSMPVRKYWKISERLMIRYSDLIICDSLNIEKYIHDYYDGKCLHASKPTTTYIAYGAETQPSRIANNDEKLMQWYRGHNLKPYGYYLMVGRFVKENNYKTIIREFMNSKSQRNLAIISTQNEPFWDDLEDKLHFSRDSRIKFVGTIYNQELLKKVRENAYAYIHGHEVGGTNPSLLESMSSTKINLLLDVEFNREVAADSAIYWTKEEGCLAKLIDNADVMGSDAIDKLGNMAVARIKDTYSWESISNQYESVFTKELEDKVGNGLKRSSRLTKEFRYENISDT